MKWGGSNECLIHTGVCLGLDIGWESGFDDWAAGRTPPPRILRGSQPPPPAGHQSLVGVIS